MGPMKCIEGVEDSEAMLRVHRMLYGQPFATLAPSKPHTVTVKPR
jgi:hypothetical protein